MHTYTEPTPTAWGDGRATTTRGSTAPGGDDGTQVIRYKYGVCCRYYNPPEATADREAKRQPFSFSFRRT